MSNFNFKLQPGAQQFYSVCFIFVILFFFDGLRVTKLHFCQLFSYCTSIMELQFASKHRQMHLD